MECAADRRQVFFTRSSDKEATRQPSNRRALGDVYRASVNSGGGRTNLGTSKNRVGVCLVCQKGENDAEPAILAGFAILNGVASFEPTAAVTVQTHIAISGVVLVGDLLRQELRQENAAIGETTTWWHA